MGGVPRYSSTRGPHRRSFRFFAFDWKLLDRFNYDDDAWNQTAEDGAIAHQLEVGPVQVQRVAEKAQASSRDLDAKLVLLQMLISRITFISERCTRLEQPLALDPSRVRVSQLLALVGRTKQAQERVRPRR